MSYRMSVSALAAVVLIAPAAVAAHPAQAGSLERTIDQLSDPDRQDALAGSLAAATSAVLELRVGPLLRALDRAENPGDPADIDPDTRLGDIAGPAARRAPDELAARVPEVMDTMGAMAGEMAALRPQLDALARRMEHAIDQPELSTRRYRD
jgi:hypothetical protein